jgi:hypothetical protein
MRRDQQSRAAAGRPLTCMLCRVLCPWDLRGIVGQTLLESATRLVDEIMWITQTPGLGR